MFGKCELWTSCRTILNYHYLFAPITLVHFSAAIMPCSKDLLRILKAEFKSKHKCYGMFNWLVVHTNKGGREGGERGLGVEVRRRARD